MSWNAASERAGSPWLLWLGLGAGLLLLGLALVAAALVFGPAMLGWAEVPNLTGLPQEQAAFYLDSSSLPWHAEEQVSADRNEDGRVISQLPGPGSYLPPGSFITLQIARFPGAQAAAEAAQSAEYVPTASTMPPSLLPPTAELTQAPEQSAQTETPTQALTLQATLQGGGSGRIAFASDRGDNVQIWLVNSDGSDALQLTSLDGGACQPDWSPDGARLVFTSPCNGNQESYPKSSLWLVNADGSGLELLSDGGTGGSYDPAWSPDGAQIAFTSMHDEGRAQIYRIDLNERAERNFSNNSVFEMQPAWSPDGKQMAFVGMASGWQTVFLYTMDSKERQQFSCESERHNTGPAWSPDGRIIIYNQVRPPRFPNLVGAALADSGFKSHTIFAEALPMRDVAFSPDGVWIAYEGWPDGAHHAIWVATVSGAQAQAITSGEELDFDPAWQPFGQY